MLFCFRTTDQRTFTERTFGPNCWINNRLRTSKKANQRFTCGSFCYSCSLSPAATAEKLWTTVGKPLYAATYYALRIMQRSHKKNSQPASLKRFKFKKRAHFIGDQFDRQLNSLNCRVHVFEFDFAGSGMTLIRCARKRNRSNCRVQCRAAIKTTTSFNSLEPLQTNEDVQPIWDAAFPKQFCFELTTSKPKRLVN